MIEAKRVTKTYRRGGETLVVLDQLDLSIQSGQLYAREIREAEERALVEQRA